MLIAILTLLSIYLDITIYLFSCQAFIKSFFQKRVKKGRSHLTSSSFWSEFMKNFKRTTFYY
uniref:Vitelline membrane cysteine-rich region protein n=1 Tax=Siphoviridae sp. ctLqe90 TaxID=2825456 RepID=A0A8S5Q3N3_9CAUD|nr:MAG TPA: vitelline membrane cysteine-rich region protein [Siphoviridae sp. ctLqe90]